MAVEARYAEKIGVARRGLADTIAETLSTLGLPTRIPEGMPLAEIIRVMRVDKKKNAAAIRFALPVEIGRVELVEVTELEEVIGNW
jgi:3-dehydroquinate synthase